MSIDSLCNSIACPSPIFNPIQQVIPWRDENPEVIRKVVTGALFAGSGLLSFIDTVASLALAILTSPLKLGGIKFTDAFLNRVKMNCAIGAMLLTVGQYDNITADTIKKAWSLRYS